jgi:hypothetical protein
MKPPSHHLSNPDTLDLENDVARIIVTLIIVDRLLLDKLLRRPSLLHRRLAIIRHSLGTTLFARSGLGLGRTSSLGSGGGIGGVASLGGDFFLDLGPGVARGGRVGHAGEAGEFLVVDLGEICGLV